MDPQLADYLGSVRLRAFQASEDRTLRFEAMPATNDLLRKADVQICCLRELRRLLTRSGGPWWRSNDAA